MHNFDATSYTVFLNLLSRRDKIFTLRAKLRNVL